MHPIYTEFVRRALSQHGLKPSTAGCYPNFPGLHAYWLLPEVNYYRLKAGSLDCGWKPPKVHPHENLRHPQKVLHLATLCIVQWFHPSHCQNSQQNILVPKGAAPKIVGSTHQILQAFFCCFALSIVVPLHWLHVVVVMILIGGHDLVRYALFQYIFPILLMFVGLILAAVSLFLLAIPACDILWSTPHGISGHIQCENPFGNCSFLDSTPVLFSVVPISILFLPSRCWNGPPEGGGFRPNLQTISQYRQLADLTDYISQFFKLFLNSLLTSISQPDFLVFCASI